MSKDKFKVGDKISTWFSGEYDSKSVILEVVPYQGKYTQWFTYTLRVTAPRTRRRWMEIAV